MAPEFAKGAALLAKKDPNLNIGKIDAIENTNSHDYFGVRGFPTLLFIKDGIPEKYLGLRTPAGLAEFVYKKSLPPSIEVSCADLAASTATSKLNLVYFGETSGPNWDTHRMVGDDTASDDFKLFHTGAECAMNYETEANGFAIVRSFDEPILPFKGSEVSVESMLAFMLSNAVASV